MSGYWLSPRLLHSRVQAAISPSAVTHVFFRAMIKQGRKAKEEIISGRAAPLKKMPWKYITHAMAAKGVTNARTHRFSAK